MSRKRKNRRGVVLLVVLSLLVLFMLLVVTLIITAGQYKTAAVATARYRRTEDDGRRIAETALYQLLRDVDPTFHSSLRDQGLLTDLYGGDGIGALVGRIPTEPLALGSFHDVTVDNSLLVLHIRSESVSAPLSRSEDYYNGRVVTFTSGAMSGYSARVVDYRLDPGVDLRWGEPNVNDDASTGNTVTDDKSEFLLGNNDDLTILVVDVAETDRNTVTVFNRPEINDRIVINGAAFNGTGFGYDKFGGALNANVWLPGPDREWGDAGIDDDTDTVPDNISEAGFGDDVYIGTSGDGWAAMFSHKSSPAALGYVGTHAVKSAASPASPITITDGGADESWDAVDFQNLYLAMIPPDPTFPGMIVPSFHRPDLIRYLFVALYSNSNTFADLSAAPGGNADARLTNAWTAFVKPYGNDSIRNNADDSFLSLPQRDNLVGLKRACIFRPLAEDHPNFNGSNPTFHYFGSPGWIDNLDDNVTAANELTAVGFGRYDVDNDGDGVPESIWMDIGLPVQTAKDGRRFRPLVAILCKDMDGRLNLNAHGSLDSHPSTLTSSFRWHPGPDGINASGGSDDRQIAGVSSISALPRGVGFGPAEINLSPLFLSTQLGELTSVLQQRYLDSRDASVRPGIDDNNDDPRSYYKHFLVPQSYGALQGRGYGSPNDVTGLGAVMLDHSGQPVPSFMGRANEIVDDPYEQILDVMTAGGVGSRQQHYFLSDFELLLRRFDADALRLPGRLVNTSPRLDVARNYVTVHSSHIPSPNMGIPMFLRAEAGARDQSIGTAGVLPTLGTFAHVRSTSPTLVDLYRLRLMEGGISDVATLESELLKIVPFEFRRGQLLDLNRPFGNGRDDNSNGAVDDFSETQQIWNSLAAADPFAGVGYEGPNDDSYGMPSRVVLARHLYCLMMLLTDEGYALPSPFPPGTLTLEQRATRIAQWAVNVVDFRDPDAIMTPFEFDISPFNADGWSVDGIVGQRRMPGPDGTLGTADDILVTDAALTDRRIVWGCEYPDLIIKENVAFHDRRVKDTNLDDFTGGPADSTDDAPLSRTAIANGDHDRDLDQYRIPQGSLFVELQCMRNSFSNNAVFPRELYNYDAGNTDAYLDLGRLSPAHGAARYPVWRLAVGPTTPTTTANAAVTNAYKANAAGTGPEIASESAAFRIASSEIERVVWFSPSQVDFNASVDMTRGFYGQTGTMTGLESDVKVYPGRYCVVGPRATTYIGSALDSADPTQFNDSPQWVTINPTVSASSTKTPNNNVVTYPVPNTNAAPGIICAADPPAAFDPTRKVGMNVSEPLPQSGSYYRRPRPQPSPLPMNWVPDTYFDPDPMQPFDPDPTSPTYNAYPDTPFDGPGVLSGNVATGTRSNFKSLYLQRLADPTLPWNPDPTDDPGSDYDPSLSVNPYITVDWSSIDLTVFSGDENTDQMVDTDNDGMTDADIDPSDPNPFSTDPPEQFVARARDVLHNVWSPRTREPFDTTANDFSGINPSPYFKRKLRHTLGYLNDTYGSPTTMGGLVGIPANPSPWMAWLNRPYASPYEIMLAPSSSPDRLLYETISEGVVPVADRDDTTWKEHPFWPNLTGTDPYNSAGGANNLRAPFAQLLNFFHSAAEASTDTAAHFYRIFDYLEVPSPFVGTEKWFDPRAFRTKTVAGNPNRNASEYRPPFNKMSRFRDPGRININTAPIAYSLGSDGQPGAAGTDDDGDGTTSLPATDFIDTNNNGTRDPNERPDINELFWPGSDDVYSGQIWEAIAKNYPAMDPTVREWSPGPDGEWGVAGTDDDGAGAIDDILEAGWPGSDDVFPVNTFLNLITSLQGRGVSPNSRDYPTTIANPFRSAASADLMPNILDMRRSGVNVGLLRSGGGDFFAPSASIPLFGATATPFFATTAPNGPVPGNGFLATDRNPYFHYQGLSRLGNLLTTHSNVFAVWITVGYFEIEDNRPLAPQNNTVVFDPAHPDGLRLGQEIGTENGEVQRHRSFFIIDRSIPVAFERGRNHNVDRAVLLRRSLE